MNLRQSNLHFTLFCLYVLLVAMRPAHAYIDPSFGSYAIQIVIAAVVGGAFAFKSFFLRLFGGLRQKNEKATTEEDKHDE